MSDDATRLEGLRIDEVSGVDDPANLAPGWIVMKALSGLDGRAVAAAKASSEVDDAWPENVPRPTWPRAGDKVARFTIDLGRP